MIGHDDMMGIVATEAAQAAADSLQQMGMRPKVVSAPTLEDLQPTEKESADFERGIAWQEASMLSPRKLGAVETEAHDLAIVMGYEAMRICLGLPTKHHPPGAVMKWMELMTLTHTAPGEPPAREQK